MSQRYLRDRTEVCADLDHSRRDVRKTKTEICYQYHQYTDGTDNIEGNHKSPQYKNREEAPNLDISAFKATF